MILFLIQLWHPWASCGVIYNFPLKEIDHKLMYLFTKGTTLFYSIRLYKMLAMYEITLARQISQLFYLKKVMFEIYFPPIKHTVEHY